MGSCTVAWQQSERLSEIDILTIGHTNYWISLLKRAAGCQCEGRRVPTSRSSCESVGSFLAESQRPIYKLEQCLRRWIVGQAKFPVDRSMILAFCRKDLGTNASLLESICEGP